MKLMHLKYLLNGIHGYILLLIELKKKHDLEKYEWQKPHQSNKTGTEEAYYPNKNKKILSIKNIKVGNLNNFFINLSFIINLYNNRR